MPFKAWCPLVFLIDMKCPAVKKGIITKQFVTYAKKLYEDKWPDKEWIKANAKDNKNKKMYSWVEIPQYLNYKDSLK